MSVKDVEEKQSLEDDQKEHIKWKDKCNQAKATNKERCQEDDSFMHCTFDLQSQNVQTI